MSEPEALVLFDPLETLGTEVAASPTRRLEEFKVYPSVRALLQRLGERARLGVFSFDPAMVADRLIELLSQKGLSPPLDPELIAVAVKEQAQPFASLLGPALDVKCAVYASLDAIFRRRALDEGLRVSPHPALIADVLDGQSLFLVRLPGGLEQLAALASNVAVVPVFVEDPSSAYAIAPESLLGGAPGASGVEAVGPAGLVDDTTLMMVQIDPRKIETDPELAAFVSGLENDPDLPLVERTVGGWMVALPSDRSIEVLHPPPSGAGHGHNRMLLPSLQPLSRAARPSGPVRRRALTEQEKETLSKLDGHAVGARAKQWAESVEGDEAE